jgi:hypothetical protein
MIYVLKEKNERRLLTLQVVSCGDESVVRKGGEEALIPDIAKGIIPDRIVFSYSEPSIKDTPQAQYVKDVTSFNKSLQLYKPHKLL